MIYHPQWDGNSPYQVKFLGNWEGSPNPPDCIHRNGVVRFGSVTSLVSIVFVTSFFECVPVTSLTVSRVCKCNQVISERVVIMFAIGISFGALVFSILFSLMANIRDSRPGETVYEAWLKEVAIDNIIPNRRDFTYSA